MRILEVADALEPPRAVHFASEAILEAIISTHNALMMGHAPLDVTDSSDFSRWAAYWAEQYVDELVGSPDVSIELFARHVALRCFENARNPTFLDTHEIPALVGLTSAIGIRLERLHAGVAGRMVMQRHE